MTSPTLTPLTHSGGTLLEGTPGALLMRTAADVDLLLEACFAQGAGGALLHPEQLTPGFFDLSSREAGEILQKLRQYHVQLAVVIAPDGPRFSSRFGEMVAEERRGRDFALFATREEALAWLVAEV